MNDDFRLAGWIVRPQRDCIERDGDIVHVKPKAMAVLTHLVQAGGSVVTRDEIFNAVWPNSEISNDALTQCIVELRKAFHDSARAPRIIETIPKIGFRMIPVAEPLDADSTIMELAEGTGTFAGKPVISVGIILLALLFAWYLKGLHDISPGETDNGAKSIAVLPFVDMSAKGDQGFFADGLTEELITRLAQINGLEVSGRTSSFHFKGKNDVLPGIAKVLGVNHLLEGSVRRDQNRLRITAQLIDARNGFHLWSKQFDRPFTEIFDIQEEIAESIANALSIKLQVGELGTIAGGTSSVEAYEEILLSMREQWKSTPESILKAIDHAKKAVEIDPGYARAWLRLAGLYINANALMGTEGSPDAYRPSEEALEQALKLEAGLAGALAMKAMIQIKTGQWAGVERTLNHGAGLQYSPDAELISVYCGLLLRVGRIHEAIPLLERARDLTPFSSKTSRMLASAYMIAGNVDKALSETERSFDLEGFEIWDVENGMLIALSAADRDNLIKWLLRAEQYMPKSRPLIDAMSLSLNDSDSALDWLRNAYQQAEKDDCLIAFWSAWHGDTALALDALRGCPAPVFFWQGVMKDVRRTPGFKDMIRELGLEGYYREFGWNDFCHPLGLEDFACE